MNKKTVFRKKALACTALVAFALLCATSCTKPIDGAQNRPLDYALQVIPDIHDVMPHDLLEAMSAIPDTINGQPVTINALHFGDNPPSLTKDSLGFSGSPVYGKLYIPSDPDYNFHITLNQPTPYSDWILISDQHRGIANIDYKRVYYDVNNGSSHTYVIEYSHETDSVFIMGKDPYFSIFFTQQRHKENNTGSEDYKSHEYVIISGELTSQGIKDYYIGIKIKKFELPGYYERGFNVNDIYISRIDFLPYTYWDPSQHYNN